MSKKIIELLSKEAQKNSEDLLWVKVVGIGNAGVGKTCLVKSFCESKFSKNYVETIGVDYGFKLHNVDGKEVRLTFWDFGGNSVYADVRKELYHQTKICILVYDVTNTSSFQALDDWLKEFESYGGKKSFFCVVGNKLDLPNKKVNRTAAEEWAKRRNMKHFLASAATGDGVSAMFTQVLTDALKSST